MEVNRILLIISISSLILNLFHGATAKPHPHPETTALNPAIKKICDATENPKVCAETIVPYLNGHTDPASVLTFQVIAAIHVTEQAMDKAKKTMTKPGTETYEAECFKVCIESYDSAMGYWKDSLQAIKTKRGFDVANHLSAASSMIQSCEDSFTNDDPTAVSNSPLTDLDKLIMSMNNNGLSIRTIAFPDN